MPLERLYGPNSLAQIANEIRYAAVVAALARGVSPIVLDCKLVHSFFHAQPWIDGVAVRSLERMAAS